jgi:hypothetical protein
MALPATDSFTSATNQDLESYSSNWTVTMGSCAVDGTVDKGQGSTGGSENLAAWNADTFDNDQYAEGVVSSLTSGQNIGSSVRNSLTQATNYHFYVGSNDSYLGKMTNGSWDQLGAGTGKSTGDVVRIEAEGTTITPKINGSTSDIGAQTDSSHSSGYAGWHHWQTEGFIDDWEGGNISAGGNDALTSTNTTAGSPSVGSSTISQAHAITASGTTAQAPTAGTSALSQNHVLTASGTTAQAPTVGTPTVSESSELSADDTTAGSPSVGSSAITQAHGLTASGVTAQAPVIDSSTITQAHGLTASDTESQAPVAGTPTVAEENSLTASDTEAQAPIIETSALAQVHALTASDTESQAPVIDGSSIGQNHALTASDTLSQAPAVETPQIAQNHALTASSAVAQAPEVEWADLVLPEYSRPASDASVGSWTTDTGSGTGLYQAIDETTPSDADYVQSESSPSASPVVFAMGAIADPQRSDFHFLRYRYGKESAGGQVNLTVELREGYVNEGSPGTLVASWGHTDISTSYVTAEQELSSAQADSITDYSDLFVRLEASEV